MPKRRRNTKGRPAKKTKTKKETATKQVEQPPRLIEFSLNEPDPVVEHLKQHSNIEASFDQLSLDTILLDQIALEGLSGITLRRLFNIVEALFPSLLCTTDLNCQRIKLFHMDLNREPQLDCDNLKGVVIDKVIKLPTQTVKRIAKSDSLLSPVQDGLIMGSCANYLTRVEITNFLVEKSTAAKFSPMECIYFLEDHYGLDNVYIVANQTLRSKAILPHWADPNVDIKLREYCALELIGRSRSLGTVFPNDKALGRYRIMLEAKGFITQFQANMSSPIEHHLKRFANHHSNQTTNNTTGNATSKSTTNGVNGKSGTCKTKQLPKTNNKKFKGQDEDEEENTGLADSDSDEDDRDADSLTLSALFFDPSKLKPNRNILSTVYDVIADSGGISQIDLRKNLHLPRFHLRNHLKNLISLEMVCTRPPKDGDGSQKNYFAPKASKRKKIKEELLASTGIMASWDEADLRAKKIIGHKRSSFSQAEDSILILCRITSVLIEPRLKLSWCVNKRLIRDLLHKELVEAHDKTSDACLRRIKYLKKLPNNIMSINELTAELQDDTEIQGLLRSKKLARRANKRFLRLFKCVRTKIPNLLGIPSGASSTSSCNSSLPRQVLSKAKTNAPSHKTESLDYAMAANNCDSSFYGAGTTASQNSPSLSSAHEINDHEELRQKYDLIDCQSVALIQRASTYETPKNVVDVKLNQASLVTMAFTMTSCFGQFDGRQRRTGLWLLDKFYSNYHDKLISSMLSKLSKRSLLTRKCPTTSADPSAPASSSSSYFAKTRLSLKLNQSVLFLLNRYQSHSLIQLANPISRSYSIDLCESNEMASIAMLTSLCSLSAFNLDMDLRIPTNVVGIDQGNQNFKSLCEKVNPGTREILARFMSRCGEGSLIVGQQETGLDKLSGKGSSESSSCDMTPTDPEPATNHIIAAESLRNLNLSHTNDMPTATIANKMDDSRRALFLLRHELKTQALDKCGSLADCLIVQPCNVKFYSNRRVELPGGVLEAFLARSEPFEVADKSHVVESQANDEDENKNEKLDRSKEEVEGDEQPAEPSLVDKWLVKGYSLSRKPATTSATATTTTTGKQHHNSSDMGAATDERESDSRAIAKDDPVQDCSEADKKSAEQRMPEDEEDLITELSFEARTRPIEFYARAWKQIDGKVHLATLFKLIESILSWLIVLPGVELDSLEREFCHLLPKENLHELLRLMEELDLISSERLRPRSFRPRLFGFYKLVDEVKNDKQVREEEEGLESGREEGGRVVYESTASAYVKYCQLLSYCNHQSLEAHEKSFNMSKRPTASTSTL